MHCSNIDSALGGAGCFPSDDAHSIRYYSPDQALGRSNPCLSGTQVGGVRAESYSGQDAVTARVSAAAPGKRRKVFGGHKNQGTQLYSLLGSA